MSEEERRSNEDPLLAPFTDLDNRKIPVQDDGMRGRILTVYLIFLLVGVPIWWYFTSVPTATIPLILAPKILPEFTVNVHSEDKRKEYSLAVGNYFFNIRSKDLSAKDYKNENKNLNIIQTATGNEIIKIDKRTVQVPSSIDLKMFLNEIVTSFEIPNLQKSEVKLRFTVLTDDSKLETKFEFNNLNNFISNLGPVLSFKPSFQTKYFDGKFSELTAEMFAGPNPIAKIDSRDERGRSDLFNLVLIKTAGDTEKQSLYIPNWGIIVTAFDGQEHVEKIFISGLKRFLGFPKNKNLPEMFEIELWTEKVKEFYFGRLKSMSKSLNTANVIKVASSKEAFDMIERLYNDPKLLAAAYFPDDHKFAVYLPVYLPLILPILVGLISILKERRKRREGDSKIKAE